MPQEPSKRSSVPFKFRIRERDFQERFTQMVADQVMAEQSLYISDDNRSKLTHGRSWKFSEKDKPSDVQSYSSEISFFKSAIIDHDTTLVNKKVDELSKAMLKKFVESLIELANAVTNQSGNVVNAKNRPFPEAFKEMLEKIEFGVDRWGHPSLPQIIAGHNAGRLVEQLQSQPIQFQDEIDAIKQRKEISALYVEACRLRNYKRQ